ncbi:MAG: sensor histidine kinase [Hungatella sp.]
MWFDKKKELKTSYYRSFLALIVIPILMIILVSVGILRTMMQDAAIQNIRRAQDHVVATLTAEVKDVSLRLSHFVYVNDNEIMKTASKTNTKDIAARHAYTQVLTESFNYAMVPVQDILSAVFFMKDGEYTYMKDDVTIPEQEVKQSAWYQEALADQDMVKIGFYDRNVTYSRQNSHTFTIVAGLSPDIDVDRDGNVEMVALFSSSQVGTLIRNYDKEERLGKTLILDRNGEILFDIDDIGDLLPRDNRLLTSQVFHQKVGGEAYTYVISEEPETGCRIVSVVASETLIRQFNQTAWMIIAVTLVLFVLFYFFSSYFLKNIIEPIHNTVEGMRRVEDGDLAVHIEPAGQAELRTMIHSFNHMTKHLGQLLQDNREQEQKKHEAELRALQSQINPHFLVNSLSSIRFIAQVSKFDSIAKMAEALMKILSCSFRSNAGFYRLREELEVLDSFLYLMKIRYSDGFEVHYEVEESCMDCLIPRLILQPIVENSIVHGFSELVDEIGQIHLSAEEEAGFLYIRIRDNGKGMSEEEIESLLSGEGHDGEDHTSIGITNVNTRLLLNYGPDCELGIESCKGEYTMTTVRLPVRRESV